jgi:hypothetical protein
MIRRIALLLSVLALASASAGPAIAQGVGSIGGTVSDASRAMLPSVTVTRSLEDDGGVAAVKFL